MYYHERRTEPRPQVTCTKNFMKSYPFLGPLLTKTQYMYVMYFRFLRYASGQIDIHTD